MNAVKGLAASIYDHFCSQYTKAPVAADVAFVFGRNDLSLASAASWLWRGGFVKNILVTGGVGKDSGNLLIPEADFLAEHIHGGGVPSSSIFVEPKATNGGQNTRLGMKMVRRAEIPHKKIILVGHATNLLRLFAAHTYISREELGIDSVEYQLFAPRYELKEGDEEVLICEYKRLLEWPTKQWADRIDLPLALTDELMVLQ